MANIVKKYFKGGLNSDVDPDLLPEGDYLNALNVKISGASDGSAGVLRLAKGQTKLVSIADNKDPNDPLEISTEDVKHIVVDEVNGDLYIFKSGSVTGGGGAAGPLIYKSSPPYSSINTVLEEGAVTDWEPTGNTDFTWGSFVSGKKVGDNLIWINDKGYQFSLNVPAIINVYQSKDPDAPGFLGEGYGIADISLIKRPPVRNLLVQKKDDGSAKNFIKDYVFQFFYRYGYVGDEISVLSPASEEVPMNNEQETYNYVQIKVPQDEIPPQSVNFVEIIVKNNTTGAINVVKKWDGMIQDERNKIIDHINGTTQLTFDFYNDKVYESIDDAYFAKQFDSIPVKSYSIEVAKDRLFLAQNTEGYDTPKKVTIALDVTEGAPSSSYIADIYRINLNFQAITDDPNIRPDWSYSAYAAYIPNVSNPGWYELPDDGGNYSNTGFEIQSASGEDCTLESNTTNLTVALANANFIYLQGFSNSGNNGMYSINTGTGVTGTGPWYINLKKISLPGNPVNENSGATLTINMTVMSTVIEKVGPVDPDVTIPTTAIDFDDINPVFYRGATLADYYSYVQPEINNYLVLVIKVISGSVVNGASFSTGTSSVDTTSNITINNIGAASLKSFKSDSRYSIGVQFYDWAMRKCGVWTNDSLIVQIPDRDYSNSTLSKFIEWQLTSDTNIPTWAKYYSVVRTDNLSTRYFIQGETNSGGTTTQLSYATKNADGKWVISDTANTYSAQVAGIALDLEPVLNKGFGYIYQEANGDIVKLYNKDNSALNTTLKVIDTSGRYIILEPKDLGTIDFTDAEWRYEIRRPYTSTTIEPFYETTVYPITDWGTVSRAYSKTTGIIRGDTSVEDSLEYMNLNAKARNTWSRNLGRPCFIDNIGQVVRPSSVRWSNTFIAGTAINGISTFDTIDYRDLPVELGPVNKLQLTSKTQSDGSVMLAIGQNRTASLYLGETTLLDNTGQSILATSGNVIGTVNVLKGIFGTTCPASVVEYDGNVYWADILNESIVRYSSNGLYAISDNGMRNYFRNYFKKKKSEINEYDITQSPYLYGGYNPLTDEYILSYASCSEAPDEYPDTSDIRYSDIRMMYRNNTPARSIAFSVTDERWTTFYSHFGTSVTFGGKMYSFVKSTYVNPDGERVAGGLFVFDKDSTDGSFGGAVRRCFISFPVNEAPNNIKLFHSISIEGDSVPDYTFIETFDPNNQVTNLEDTDWKVREGIRYAEFYRDRVSPNTTGTADEKMYKGDKMRGVTGFVSMLWDAPSSFFIRFINTKIKDSIGHNLIQQ